MNNTKLLIIGGIAGIIVLGLLTYLVVANLGGSSVTEKITLQFWGVFDDAEAYDEAIRDYERLHPNVRIAYREFTYEDYERQLLGSFAAGTGPDVWLMHNTWLPKHGDKIQPLPQEKLPGEDEPLFTYQRFKNEFVDVAAQDLTSQGQIYALPLYVDTLGLFYNKDLFNSAGISQAPKTWAEFNDLLLKLTEREGTEISRAGAALGTARNVNRSTDILSLLMLQSGVRMTNDDNTAATFSRSVSNQNVSETAIQYYTDFADPDREVYTWNAEQPYSIDAFLTEKAAMMLNYSHQIQNLRAQAPRLNFATAPAPQIGTGKAVTYANYWAPTVSKQSKAASEAWRFVTYLVSRDGASFYLNASYRPTARRDLIDFQAADIDLGPFAKQTLSARSWYQADSVAIESIFAELIEDVVFGRSSIRDALRSAEGQVNVLMQRREF